MVLLLYGQDTFLARKKLADIIARYKSLRKSMVNLRMIDANDDDFQDFRQALSSVSMFKEKKLLVCANAFQNPAFKKELLSSQSILEKNREDIILFFEEGNIAAGDSLLKFLAKIGKVQNFKALKGQQIALWIKKEVELCGEAISPAAVAKLMNLYGADLWKISRELQKLAAYKKSAVDPVIQETDVDLLCEEQKLQSDIFSMIDAAAQRKRNVALELLHGLLAGGTAPLYLLSMLHFQIRNITLLKYLSQGALSFSEILRKSTLHPFAARKALQLSRDFHTEKLKLLYEKLLHTDVAIKTGKQDPGAALEALLLSV